MTTITLPPLPPHPHNFLRWSEAEIAVIRALQLATARVVLEACAKACDRLYKKQQDYFAGMGSAGMPDYGPSDCADAIRSLEFRHE